MLTRNIKYKNSKPPMNSRLAKNSPYYNGMVDCLLFNEGAGANYLNIGSSKWYGFPKGGLSIWNNTGKYKGPSTTSIKAIELPSKVNIVAGDFAIRALFRMDSFNGTYACIFSKKAGGVREFGIFIDSSGNLSFYDIGGSSGFGGVGLGLTTGVMYDMILTRIGTEAYLYLNGILKLNTGNFSGGVTGTTGSTTNPISLGWDETSYPNNYGINTYYAFQTWAGRGLTAGEVLDLYNNPFSFVRPIKKRIGIQSSSAAVPPVTIYNRRSFGYRAGSRGVF